MTNYIKEHGYDTRKIHDCHYHIGRQYPNRESSEKLRKHREYLNLEKMLILSLTEGNTIVDHTANIKALFHKEDDKGNMYSFAALHHFHDERDSAEGYLNQIKLYYDMGFDGIKMLEGKGECRGVFPQPLDSSVYEEFFSFAEEKEFPILIHAGDVHSSSDEEKLYNEILGEVVRVLEKHPKLHMTFAHVLFLWEDKERLENILDTYVNTSFDLAMGGSFLLYFSKDIDTWRKFFMKYSDRILFATDNWNSFEEGDDDFEVTCRHTPIRDFFEQKSEFKARIFGDKRIIKPILLPEGAVNNIYRNNFIRLFGEKPREIDYTPALKYAQWLLCEYQSGNLKTYSKGEEMPPWYTEAEKRNMLRGSELAIENLEEIIGYYKKILSL